MNTSIKLAKEIDSFQALWNGGFRTGYRTKRNQKGIEEYLREKLIRHWNLLEIGCGGGQWSKLLCTLVEHVYCVDILSAQHNRFWAYVGQNNQDKITYLHVKDFSLDDIPDNSLDYVFSYDVFCHISLSGQDAYLESLRRKCKDDAVLCIMYGDGDKYFANEPENIPFQERDYNIYDNHNALKQAMLDDCDGEPFAGRWYWVGIENFLKLCAKHRYRIIDRDLNIDKSNPITLFTKTCNSA